MKSLVKFFAFSLAFFSLQSLVAQSSTTMHDEKAQVPNSGLKKLVNKGETSRTGVVELSIGDYQYSCPLNPTPHYSLTVAE